MLGTPAAEEEGFDPDVWITAVDGLPGRRAVAAASSVAVTQANDVSVCTLRPDPGPRSLRQHRSPFPPLSPQNPYELHLTADGWRRTVWR
eukprot:gene27314-56060_t